MRREGNGHEIGGLQCALACACACVLFYYTLAVSAHLFHASFISHGLFSIEKKRYIFTDLIYLIVPTHTEHQPMQCSLL